MAYSIQREVSDGTLQTLTLRIAYFKKTHISVYVDDKLADGSAGRYSWVWDGDRIRLNAVVPVGIEVMIRRKTPMDTPFHNFRQGAVFKDVTMDENFIQQLYINQENVEGLSATDFYSELDLHNYRMKNVGTAINDADAVSLGQYRADALGANQYRILAEGSKVAAKAAEVATVASAAAALVSENKTKASETAAKLSEVNSKASEDTVVPLVPIVDKAARDAAAASAQAALASAEAKQAVIDVKNLGAVPIGTVLDFPRGSIPAGYLVANGSTFDATTYPDLQAFLGSNKLPNVKARNTEMFSIEWWGGKRSAIPAGAVPADGQLLDDSVFPEAAANIKLRPAASVPVILDADWLADATKRGSYTKTATQFRTPDLNGKQPNSLGAIFTRGDGTNSAGEAGRMQGDTLQQHEHGMNLPTKHPDGVAANVEAINTTVASGGNIRLSWLTGDGVGDTQSRVADRFRVGWGRRSEETRPISATGCWIIWLVPAPVVPLIKAAGVLANEGMAQLDGVKAALRNLYGNFIGVPIPWGNAPVPTGYIKLNGQTFDKANNPRLAAMYPSGTVPDLRGEFLRGFDDGRGVDAGRVLGSGQGHAYEQHAHGGNAVLSGNGVNQFIGFVNSTVGDNMTGDTVPPTKVAGSANETRPRNIAMLYICMTDTAIPL